MCEKLFFLLKILSQTLIHLQPTSISSRNCIRKAHIYSYEWCISRKKRLSKKKHKFFTYYLARSHVTLFPFIKSHTKDIIKVCKKISIWNDKTFPYFFYYDFRWNVRKVYVYFCLIKTPSCIIIHVGLMKVVVFFFAKTK